MVFKRSDFVVEKGIVSEIGNFLLVLFNVPFILLVLKAPVYVTYLPV